MNNLFIAWGTTDISPVEKLAMIYVAECSGMDVWIPDHEKLATFAGCSRREVEHALISLRGDHYLGVRESVLGRGRGYFVVDPDGDEEPYMEPSYKRIRPIDVSVYILGEDYPGSTLVKVGVSSNPRRRCAGLEREKGRNLHVAHRTIQYTRPAAMKIERSAHEELNKWALGGEWFTCGAEVALEAVRACGGEVDYAFEAVL